ncbi:hypothetical protein [Hyphomonas sp. UBA3601]|uniref:hypothetical protein n=1 Tax=Hyphomonas sp. UBA3601 TaxID=1946626 RepID=UPI0025BF12EF|nr:hypothetical protein [Hyphomonas sp. UBA3601]
MQTRFDAKIAVLFVVVPVWLVASAALQGTLGSIGPDGDDVMRLVQIKDLLNGQDWFDLHQYRMGPDGGTAMHWSRLVDLPILALFSLFDLFLPSETALVWAYSAWPPLSVLIVLGGLYVGARQVGGRAGSLACLVLSIFVYSAHYRFRPGAIDHHNLQLALMAVAMGLALDPQRRASRAVGAGLALAASVAIGGEVYVFAAAICAFMALDWAVSGAAAMRSAAGFGAGLAAGLEIAFFATVAPSQYTVVACDALSAVSLLAGMAGGFGLAAAALLMSGRIWWLRLGTLALVGAACAGALVLVGPECLSNPLDELSPDVKTLWLDRVDEARPIFAERSDLVAKLGFCLGITVLALGLCLYGLYRRQRMRANFLFVALLVSAVAMTLYQTRFYVFGHLFAVIPLGLWIADIYRTGKARNASSVAYIGALALSVPFLWALPGLLVSPAVETNKTGDKADCLQDGLFATLETLPKGRVLAPADFGPNILNRTDHNVLQGNYHRNQDGISQAIELLLSHAGETRAKLSRSRIDYIVTCPADAETKLMTTHDQDGFAARLKRQEIPDFLENIPLDTGAKTPARLYRVLGDGAVDQKDEDLS